MQPGSDKRTGLFFHIAPIFSSLLLTFSLSIFTIFFKRICLRGLSMLYIRDTTGKSRSVHADGAKGSSNALAEAFQCAVSRSNAEVACTVSF